MLHTRCGLGASRSSIRTYITNFPNAEFQNGLWTLGGTNGLDWTDPTVSGNHAFGTQDAAHGFDDSIAELKGLVTDISEIETTIYVDAVTPPTGIIELEHLHRRSTTAHSSTGYECNFGNGGAYADIVGAWRGPKGTVIGDFDFVVPTGTYSVAGGFATGMRIKTRMAGDTISCWVDKNDGLGYVALYSVTDTAGADGHARWKRGTMGVGFYRESSNNNANKFAFTNAVLKAL